MTTITLQIGSYSNFIATHVWNLHEEELKGSVDSCESGILNYYRHSTNDDKRSPRTVILDLQENFPRLSAVTNDNILSNATSLWQGQTKVIQRNYDGAIQNPELNPMESSYL